MLTQAQLQSILHYDRDTGVFTWRVSTSNRAPVGSISGCVDPSDGYILIKVMGKIYRAHRLAWLYTHGVFPPDKLDHINRIRTDNRLCNLRLATNAENMQNISMPTNNTSGYIGVTWCKRDQKWHAQIMCNRKQINLGRFNDLNDAVAARKAGKQKYHTFTAIN